MLKVTQPFSLLETICINICLRNREKLIFFSSIKIEILGGSLKKHCGSDMSCKLQSMTVVKTVIPQYAVNQNARINVYKCYEWFKDSKKCEFSDKINF